MITTTGDYSISYIYDTDKAELLEIITVGVTRIYDVLIALLGHTASSAVANQVLDQHYEGMTTFDWDWDGV